MNPVLPTWGANVAVIVAGSLLVGCGAAGDGPSATPSLHGSPKASGASADGTGALVVFDGDSLTVGYRIGSRESYPSQVARSLPEGTSILNVAVSGQTWPDLSADAVEEVDAQYSVDRPANVVVVWAAANDLAMGYTAKEVAHNARDYCAQRRRHGFAVVLLTMYPLQPRSIDADYERERRAYNELLRVGWHEYADALVDVAADSRLGDESGQDRSRYFLDPVHLNAAGYRVIAELVAQVLRPLIGSPAQ